LRFLCVCAALLLAACAEPGAEPGLKAIVGGRLEPSLDAEPVPFSVIVIAGGKIRAAGPQAEIPVPKGAETLNAKGKVIQPMPYTGKIAPGESADLMIRDAETLAPERLMRAGEWVR
jgi:imidazolonepropionase-like amidohydrolase